MFTFTGRIGRKAFFWGSALRIALFAATVVGFPLFLTALVSMTGCRGIGGACGAVGLVGAMAYKPLVFVLFVFSFIGISMRRASDAGLPGWTGLFIPLLWCADRAFLVFSGAPWSLAFSSGVLFTTFPAYALLALAVIGILCMLPTRGGNMTSSNPFGAAGWIAFGLGVLVSLSATVKALSTFPALLPFIYSIGWAGWPIAQYTPYVMIALVAVLIWIAWRERGYVATATDVSGPAPPQAAGLPIMRLLLCSLGLAIAAVATSVGSNLLPLVLLVQATTIVLPTTLLYFCVLLGAYMVFTRRSIGAVTFLAVALLPIAGWAYSYWQASSAAAREATEVAAIPTTVASRIPRTMVIESRNVSGMRAVWQVPGIDRVIYKGAYGSRLVQFDRPTGRSQNQQQVVNALPEHYLLLRIGRSSTFADKQKTYPLDGGPFELRLVNPDGDRLIGIQYYSLHPPVLTEQGWFRQPNTTTAEGLTAVISDFLRRSLRSATASMAGQ